MSNCNRLTTLFPSAMLEEHAEGTERNNNIGRAQRFQVLYTFLRSMWVLLIGGALLHGLGLIAFWCVGYNVLWTPLQSSVIIISLAGIDVITYLRRVKYTT